jgi:hypothetical protein
MRGSPLPPPLITKDVRQCIEGADVVRLFTREKLMQYVRSVDFFLGEHVRNGDNGRYTLQLLGSFPARRERGELVCLFPLHPTPACQVLDSSGYYSLAAFNTELNARFRVSGKNVHLGNVRFAVAYGENVFWCKEITGNIYVQWARHINRVNAGNVANTLFRNAPLIVTTDGNRRPTCMYVLRHERVQSESDLRLLPMERNNPTMLLPRVPLWVCDAAPDPLPHQPIYSISEREAQAVLTAPSRGPAAWLPFERNVFDTSGGGSGAAAATSPALSVLDDGVLDVIESPREIIMTRVRQPQVHVALFPTLRGAPEPNPFADDGDDDDDDDHDKKDAPRAALGGSDSDGGTIV